MGFLLGAFGKLAAGRRVRQLQARMMRVQSRLRRATRQIETTSKMIETQKKMALNNLSRMQYEGSIMAGGQEFATANGFGDIFAKMGAATGISGVGDLFGSGNSQLKDDEKLKYSQYQSFMQQTKATMEMRVAQEKNRIEEYFERLNDVLLEPLKMEEDSLQTEKDSLESQIQIAQADYDACKKMEQADAKNLAPNYTGQG